MKKQVRKEQDEKETLVDWLKGIGLVGIPLWIILFCHHTISLRVSILLPLPGYNFIADDFLISLFELSTGRIFTSAQVFVPSGICSV